MGQSSVGSANYTGNRKWSDVFIPHLKWIVSQSLLVEASVEEDTQRNTDIVLAAKGFRVSCRVRRMSQVRYADEFTTRWSVPSGYQTETEKILAGHGDYMIYGFGDEQRKRVVQWRLIDLSVFRAAMARGMVSGQLPGKVIPNPDRTAFRAYKFADFPSALIVASDCQ